MGGRTVVGFLGPFDLEGYVTMQHQAVVRTHIDELLSDAQVILTLMACVPILRAVEMAVGSTLVKRGSSTVLLMSFILRIARTI